MMFTENSDEERILNHIRQARRRKKTETYIIRVVDGILIFMRAETVIHHGQTHDFSHITQSNGNG